MPSFSAALTSTKPIFTRENVYKGQWQDYFALGIFICVLCPLLYMLYKHPNRNSSLYYGDLAWIRAFIFFSLCIIIGWSTGVFDLTYVHGYSLLSLYSNDTTWLILTPLMFILIFINYWIIWPMGTVIYGRGKHRSLLWQIFFGIVNGLTENLLNLSIWAVCEMTYFPRWGTFLLFFCIQGGWKANWDTRYWNVYVTPEHNVMSWNGFKILTVHMPAIFITLAHLILFEQSFVFVMALTLALIGTNIFTCILPPYETTWRNPPKDKIILLYKDKARAECWDGQNWNEKSDTGIKQPFMMDGKV